MQIQIKIHTVYTAPLSPRGLVIFVFCERTGIATPHALGSNPKNIKYKIYHTLPIVLPVVAEYHGSMYQSGQLPSKKYRALPWGLSTTVACTRVSSRLPSKKYRGKCYQPQKSFPRRALNSTAALDSLHCSIIRSKKGQGKFY